MRNHLGIPRVGRFLLLLVSPPFGLDPYALSFSLVFAFKPSVSPSHVTGSRLSTRRRFQAPTGELRPPRFERFFASLDDARRPLLPRAPPLAFSRLDGMFAYAYSPATGADIAARDAAFDAARDLDAENDVPPAVTLQQIHARSGERRETNSRCESRIQPGRRSPSNSPGPFASRRGGEDETQAPSTDQAVRTIVG